MIVFDGIEFAQSREAELARRVAALDRRLKIAAVLFTEDKGSQLYTGLKKQAAERVGISYEVHEFSVTDPVEVVTSLIDQLGEDESVTGIIIQKPWRKTWEVAMQHLTAEQEVPGQDFAQWWNNLVSRIPEGKDVDGLHPQTLEAVERGTWRKEGRVLPATAKAVLSILDAYQYLKSQKYIVLGKSDILGKPLSFELRNLGFDVEMLGRKELTARVEAGSALRDADVVISATGQMHLVTGEMIKDGAVLVDVGEPRTDIQRASVEGKAAFLTPVPGGVGPVTVVSLLENAVLLHAGFGSEE